MCVLSINESLEQIGRALYLLLSGSRERRASEDSWDSRGSLQQTRMGNLTIWPPVTSHIPLSPFNTKLEYPKIHLIHVI